MILVPESVPPEGFVPIASVTEAEEEVTTLSFAPPPLRAAIAAALSAGWVLNPSQLLKP